VYYYLLPEVLVPIVKKVVSKILVKKTLIQWKKSAWC